MATAVTVDPLLRNLHGDPRFQALLAKMKLDEESRRYQVFMTLKFDKRIS
jgi:hypothetical protein